MDKWSGTTQVYLIKHNKIATRDRNNAEADMRICGMQRLSQERLSKESGATAHGIEHDRRYVSSKHCGKKSCMVDRSASPASGFVHL